MISVVIVFDALAESIGSVLFSGAGTSGLAQGTLSASEAAFYAARCNFNGSKYVATIRRVSAAAANVQTWTLPDAGIGSSPGDTLLQCVCVSWDGQTLYYSARNGSGVVDKKIRQYDLGNSTGLSDLAADGSLTPCGLVALPGGEVVSVWMNTSTSAAETRVYSSTGSLVNAFPATYSSNGARITRSENDQTVWIWIGLVVSQIRLSDGAVLNSFVVSDNPGVGVAFFVVRQGAGDKLLSVSFKGGRDIQVDGSAETYGAPHWEPSRDGG